MITKKVEQYLYENILKLSNTGVDDDDGDSV